MSDSIGDPALRDPALRDPASDSRAGDSRNASRAGAKTDPAASPAAASPTLPEMRPVYSSFIQSIGYDPDTESLYIQFRDGRSGRYLQVPANIAGDVWSAPSIGTAMHALVRGHFAFESFTFRG